MNHGKTTSKATCSRCGRDAVAYAVIAHDQSVATCADINCVNYFLRKLQKRLTKR